MSFEVEAMPGLEGRIVEIDEYTRFNYVYNQDKEIFEGKLNIITQFPISTNKWELTKAVKSILDEYNKNTEGNGWFIDESHVTNIIEYNPNTTNEELTHTDEIELANFFMQNESWNKAYAYTIYFNFKQSNILVLQKEKELLQQEKEILQKENEKLQKEKRESMQESIREINLESLTDKELTTLLSAITKEKLKRQNK